jgi:hypothetical protein
MVQWLAAPISSKIKFQCSSERHSDCQSMNIKQCLSVMAAALGIAAAPYAVHAADQDPAFFVTAKDTWNFEITPYAWLPGLKGDVTVRDINVGVDQSFSDLFKALKFASDALAIARYNEWLIYTQVDYFNLSTTQLDNAPVRGSLDVKDTLFLVGAGFRVNGWASGQTFDILAAVQGLHSDNTLSIYRFGNVSKTNTILDAVIMIRPSWQFSQHWIFNPTISVGGGDSQLTYQLQPQFQYQFNSTWEMRFGYRRLSYNVNSDRGNNLDVRFSGPLIGFGAQF